MNWLTPRAPKLTPFHALILLQGIVLLLFLAGCAPAVPASTPPAASEARLRFYEFYSPT